MKFVHFDEHHIEELRSAREPTVTWLGKPPQGCGKMSATADRRKFARRSVDFGVRLLFPTTGLRNVLEANVRLKDISEGGALMSIGTLSNVPDFFYIQFGSDKSEMIGCYVAGRAPGLIRAQFCNEMATSHLDQIIEQARADALVDELFGEIGGQDGTAEDAMRALFKGGN